MRAAASPLLPAHPRLILTSARAAALGALPASSDPFAQLFVSRTLAQADAQLASARATARAGGGAASSAPNAREGVRTTYTLSVAAALSGNASFAAGAVAALLRAAAAPSWDANSSVPQLPTGEMLHAVALGFDWHYAALAPGERALVVGAVAARLALVRAALAPAPPPYAAAFVSTHSNWNTVMLSGTVIACLAVEGEPGAPPWVPALRAAALANVAAWSARAWAPAGAWPEGVNYGGYAARYLVPLVESLLSATGGDGGLRALGALGAPRWLAASVAPTRPFPELWAYFDARGTPETLASFLAIAHWARDAPAAARVRALLVALAPQSPDDDEETTAMNAPLACLYYEPPGAEGGELPLANAFAGPLTSTFRSSWADENATFIAFKGHNTSDLWAHAHLDAGSFAFATHGQWFAQELGSDNYAAPGYFSPARFRLYRTNVTGHNTLSIGGRNPQCDVLATYASVCPPAPMVAWNVTGAAAAARGAAGALAVDAFAVVNLTAGFVAAPIEGLLRAARGFLVGAGRSALVTVDEVAVDARAPAPLPLWWSLHTVANVSLAGAAATLTTWNVSVPVTVALLNAAECAGAAFSVTPLDFAPPLLPAPGARVLRLVADDARLCKRLIVAVAVGAVDVNVTDVRPLADWQRLGPFFA